MKNKFLPFCYAVYFAIFILAGTFNFVYDRFNIGQAVDIPISEFQIIDMKKIADNQFVAVTGDPQLVLADAEKYNIRTLKYTLLSGGKGSKSVYYTSDKNAEFTEKKCIFSSFNAKDTAKFIFPYEKITQLRLDISSVFAEYIEIDKVTVNYKPGFFEYFEIRAMDIARFLVLPIIIAGVIVYIKEVFDYYKKFSAQTGGKQ